MKKLLLLLLVFISLNATAQKDYFSKRVQFGVTPLSNSTDKLGTIDAQGFLNKSTISVQDLIDGLSPDLSNYVTKTLPENITGEKTFIKDASGGGALFRNNSTTFGLSVNNNLSGTGMFMDNVLIGTSLSMFNRASGTSLFMVNEGSGNNQKVNQTFDSTGNTYQVSKQKTAGGAYTDVFKIDNVGNTMLQELEIEQASENTVSDEVLVRGSDNKVGFVSKASISPDMSDVMFKSVDETITGKKTFIKDGSGGGIVLHNQTGTGFYVSNSSTGFGSLIDNQSTGTGSKITNQSTGFGSKITNQSTGTGSLITNQSTGTGSLINNQSTGTGSKITNSYESDGDSFVIEKQYVPFGALTEVFSIDNVGNLTAQEATLEVINEDLTASKILVADNTGKVGHQNKNIFWSGDNATLSKNIDGITLADDIAVTGSYRPAASDTSNPLGLHSHIAHYQHPTTNDYGFQLMSTYDLNDGRLFYRNEKLGNWSAPKEIYTTGNTNLNAWVLYGNTSTTVQSISANTPTVLNNNGGYYNNNKLTDLYNTTTQQLDLTEAKQNDNLSIVLEVEIETLSNSQVVYMQYRGAIGSANEWSINLTNEVYYKNQGTRNMVCKFDVPLEFVQDITNPAEITIFSDGALNAKTKYHYLKIN